MTLAIDAKTTTAAVTAGATSLDNTSLTVGAGATGLLAFLVFNTVNLIPSGESVHWDSAGTNQAMTLITSVFDPDFNGEVQIWGLVNPTTGSGKTLSATWTSSAPAVLAAISFSGGVTTSVATAFINSATGGNNVSSTPTLALTGASGNISVCVYDDDSGTTSTGLTATSSTAWFNDSSQNRLSVRGATAPSASTVTWTGAPTSAEWAIAGVDVVAGTATSNDGTGSGRIVFDVVATGTQTNTGSGSVRAAFAAAGTSVTSITGTGSGKVTFRAAGTATQTNSGTGSANITFAAVGLQAGIGNIIPRVGPTFFTAEITAFRPGTTTFTFDEGLGVRPASTLSQLPDAQQGTTVITASDLGYRTMSTDPDGVVAYPPILTSAFQVNRQFNLDPTKSNVGASWGTLTLSNADGRFDTIAGQWNSDNRPVIIKYGAKGFDPDRVYYTDPSYADLLPAFIGVATPWFLTDTELQVPLRDASYFTELPLQTTLYGGTGGLEGTANLRGKPKPKARGGTSSAPIRNVSPVLVDPVNLIFQYNDGPGTVVQAYEGGDPVWTNAGDTSDLYSGSTPPGEYRTDNSRGLFQLGSTPIRTVTLDVTGSFPNAGVVTQAALIARYLLTEDLAVDEADVNTDSFVLPIPPLDGVVSDAAGTRPAGTLTQLSIGAPSNTARDPAIGTAGIYYGPDDMPEGPAALDFVLASFGGAIIPDRNGKLKLLLLRDVSSSPLVFISGNQTFSTSGGDVYRIDGELNSFWTPLGGTETALGVIDELGFFAQAMAYDGTTVYTQDVRDNTWHTFDGSTFSGPVPTPVAGVPSVSLDTTNLVSLTPQQLPSTVSPPAYRVRVGYAKNYTIMASGVSPSADEAKQQYVAGAGPVATWIDNSVQQNWLRPNDVEIPTALLEYNDAVAAAGVYGTLWGQRRRLYLAVMPIELALQLDLGEDAKVTWPADDLHGGKNGQIVGEAWKSDDSTITFAVLV
jgi:hypothetical protein